MVVVVLPLSGLVLGPPVDAIRVDNAAEDLGLTLLVVEVTVGLGVIRAADPDLQDNEDQIVNTEEDENEEVVVVVVVVAVEEGETTMIVPVVIDTMTDTADSVRRLQDTDHPLIEGDPLPITMVDPLHPVDLEVVLTRIMALLRIILHMDPIMVALQTLVHLVVPTVHSMVLLEEDHEVEHVATTTCRAFRSWCATWTQT
mmetsp:Transcript_18476/g.28170  ORF Transcript_18476/g.28170 Transcript_18476/m.28170 type:complete len:200 (-) Transcript_18476:1542-2141(-)